MPEYAEHLLLWLFLPLRALREIRGDLHVSMLFPERKMLKKHLDLVFRP